MDSSNQTRAYVLNMLQLDHKRLLDYFVQFDQSYVPAHKESFAVTALNELAIHSHLEEEIFYLYVKTVKPVLADLIDRCFQQHATIDNLIADLDFDGDADRFADQFLEIAEQIKTHIQFEENEIFVQLDDVDLGAIQPILENRRNELLKQESGGNQRSFTPQTNLYEQQEKRQSA